MRIQDVTPDVAEAMGLADAKGALITDVPDGPAKDAGMMSGDVITNFTGQDVADTRDLVRRVADAPMGEAVRVVVLRDGKTETLSVTLGRREEAEGAACCPQCRHPARRSRQRTEASGPDHLAADRRSRPRRWACRWQRRSGRDGGGPGVRGLYQGPARGDVITEAGQQKVVRLKDLKTALTEAKDAGRKSLLLLIRRDGDPRFVALGIE